jgi:hypothetical protein
LHPLETITPAAQTWGLPVIDYSVVPNKDADDDAAETEINARTQEAARDLMSKHEYDGKIVVIAWEHKHIGSRKLEKDYRGQDVTFRQLLRLDRAPESWSDTNYDYLRSPRSQPSQVPGRQTDVYVALQCDSGA